MLKINRSTTPMNIQLFADLDDPELQAAIMQMFERADQQAPSQTAEQEAPIAPPDGAMLPSEQAAQEPTAQNVEPQQVTDQPQADPNGGQPAPAGPQQQELLGGKFKSVDDLLAAYQNIESFAGRKAQEAAQYKAMLEQIQNQQTMQQDPAPQAQMQPAQQTSSEGVSILEDDEALAEMLYSNPAKVIQLLREEARREAQTAVQPLIERDAQAQAEQAWRETVDAFAATHPDYQDWSESMSQFIMENPQLRNLPNVLEIAYNAVRGQAYVPPAPAPDPATYLQDQEFVKNHILTNPDIKNQIIQQYLTELANGGQPLSIGQVQAGGSILATPPKQPRTIEEAGEVLMGWLNKQR